MQQLKTALRAGIPLGFGIFNMSVSIHAAVGEDESAGLRTVCAQDGHEPTPIKQTQTCPICGNTAHATFGRAHDNDGVFEVIPPEVLAQGKEAAAEFKKALDLTVHPAADVSAVLLPSGKAYYLSLKTPNKSNLEAYAALVLLIKSSPELAFMTKYTLSTAVSLFQLTVAGESTLMLRQMADADLIRKHPVLDLPEIDPRAIVLSRELAEQKLVPFTVAEHGTSGNTFVADYLTSLTTVTASTPSGGTVTDLTAALAAAVKAGAKPVRKPRASRRPAAAKAS